jgi:predicted nucleic acid-binding protein
LRPFPPSTLRDTVLALAHRGLFQPLWSERILEETRRNILAKRPNVVPARLDRTFVLMRSAFDGACVENFEPLETGLWLPDPDDRHVLAAAVVGGAQAIVTKNLKDFPAAALRPFDMEAVHPDDFLLDQLDLAPRVVVGGLHDQVGRFKNPPMDLIGLLTRLERDDVPFLVEEVRRRTAP